MSNEPISEQYRVVAKRWVDAEAAVLTHDVVHDLEKFLRRRDRATHPLDWFADEARNLAVRHQVWASPRLPADRVEREALILEARMKLLKELARDGVLC